MKIYINNLFPLVLFIILTSCASKEKNHNLEVTNKKSEIKDSPSIESESVGGNSGIRKTLGDIKVKPVIIILEDEYIMQNGKLKSEAKENRKSQLQGSIQTIMHEVLDIANNIKIADQNNHDIPDLSLEQLEKLEDLFTDKYKDLQFNDLYSEVLGGQLGCNKKDDNVRKDTKNIRQCVEMYMATEENGVLTQGGIGKTEFHEKLASDEALRTFIWGALYLVKSEFKIERLDEKNYKITVKIPTPEIYSKTLPISKFYE